MSKKWREKKRILREKVEGEINWVYFSIKKKANNTDTVPCRIEADIVTK